MSANDGHKATQVNAWPVWASHRLLSNRNGCVAKADLQAAKLQEHPVWECLAGGRGVYVCEAGAGVLLASCFFSWWVWSLFSSLVLL